MENKYTISETFTLPSHGKIYSEPINPEIELRSMTTLDELKRTAPSKYMYKNLCETIEGCIVGTKPKVHVYDMCIGDFVFLLHKLRIVTYGAEYRLKVRCPNCKKIVTGVTNLNNETVLEWDDSILDNLEFTLPRTGDKIKLKYTSPRMLDEIQTEKERRLEKAGENVPDIDLGMQLTLQALVDTVNGEKLTPSKLETYVNTLPAMDMKYILAKSEAVDGKIGLDTQIVVKCSNDKCRYDIVTSFRLEPEFFNPTI